MTNVFKQGTKTVKPQFLIDECGFDSEHADRQTDSLQGQKIAKEILDIEAALCIMIKYKSVQFS